MVAPTPEKAISENLYISELPPLFFEFALEPSPVSFKPQPHIAVSSTDFKSKKLLSNSVGLVIGILLTAIIFGSGILNNELLTGKSGMQASVAVMPAITKATKEPVSIPAISPETAELTSESEKAVADHRKGRLDPTPDIAVSNVKKSPLMTPVFPSDVKFSNATPTISPAVRTATQQITSEAFHNIKNLSALDGKKTFIKFGAKWCLPCKMMDTNVFPDPEISQILTKNYHTLSVDVDNIDGINLKQFYQVETLPSFIILDSQQRIVGRHEGAKRIEELRGILGAGKP